MVVVIGGLSMCQRQPSTPPTPKVQAAAESCGLVGRAGDAGRTLTLNTMGKQDTSGDSMPTVRCVLAALATPESVTAHMGQTRALDGIQTEAWGGVTARWSFHPDSGMTLILTSTR